MEQVQSITLGAVWEYALVICAALITFAKVWDIIKHWGKHDLKEEIKIVNAKLDKDNKRIEKLEETASMTMQALLAMINHEIDGNNVSGLKDMRTRITTYLTTK